jgi:hypothetical protein
VCSLLDWEGEVVRARVTLHMHRHHTYITSPHMGEAPSIDAGLCFEGEEVGSGDSLTAPLLVHSEA